MRRWDVALRAGSAVLQRRPTWVGIASQVLVFLAMSSTVTCVAMPADYSGLIGPIALFVLFGGSIGMLAIVLLSRLDTKTERGFLTVDDDGIAVGQAFVPAADIATGLTCNVVDTQGVVLRTRGATTTIDVNGPFVGPLVDALRVHFRAQPRFPVFARSTWAQSRLTFFSLGVFAALLVTIGVFAGSGYAFVAALPSLLVLALVFRASHSRNITVGAEGISIRTPIGTETRISYSDIQLVNAVGPDVRVTRRDGSVAAIGFGLSPEGEHWKRCVMRAEMLTAVIDAARGAYDQAGRIGEAGRKAAILARGGRDVRDWMHALRTLNETQASFRSATIPDEELWRIAEDPTGSAPVRVAAAVALRDRLDEDGRRRLQLVADACVVPRLRIALDAASLDDDATVARALEELEEDAVSDRGAAAARRVVR